MSEKKHFIYSTMTDPVLYTGYRKGGAELPVIERQVLIKGGAGLADKNFVTPRGVLTAVDDEDLEFLMQHSLFKFHKDGDGTPGTGGFIEVSKAKTDPDKVASDMKRNDGASPMTEADFAPGTAPGEKVDAEEVEMAKAAPTMANAGKRRRS